MVVGKKDSLTSPMFRNGTNFIAAIALVSSVLLFFLYAMTGGDLFNYASFASAVLGLTLAGSFSFTRTMFVVLVLLILYLPYRPILGLVSVAPLIALCFRSKLSEMTSLDKQVARNAPLLAALLMYATLILFSDPSASHNIVSICILYLFFIQILFLGSPRPLLVLLSVAIAFLLGNKSGLVLALFLVPRLTFKNVFVSAALLALMILPLMYFDLDQFARDGPVEPRLFSNLEAIYKLREDGLVKFFSDNNFDFVPMTPGGYYDFHNSWLRLIYYDHLVGLLKIALFALSTIVIPFFWSAAIFLRASVDSFFLSNGLDIIFLMMVVKMGEAAVRERRAQRIGLWTRRRGFREGRGSEAVSLPKPGDT